MKYRGCEYKNHRSCIGKDLFGGINNLKQSAVNPDRLPMAMKQIPKASFLPPKDELVVINRDLVPSNESTAK